MGTIWSDDYYFYYTKHFKPISTYTLIDQRFIRLKHNGYPLCVICNYNIINTNEVISQCKLCHMFIGHEKCIKSKYACPKCNK